MMAEVARDVLMVGLAGVGLFFMLVAAIGVLRMPDLFTRMHAATKASTLGISSLALAALVHFADFSVTARLLLIILFFFLTAPVATHALARAAYACDVQLAPATRRFDLERARILCPTRGGQLSAALHEKAVQLARESLGELTFLYVIGHSLADQDQASSEVRRVLAEMRSLGQGVLAAAQAQARAQGIQARSELRVGEVEAEILHVAEEWGATVVVLGYPEKDSADEQHAAEEQLWRMADAVQKASGARVVIAR
ncbi:MAG: Na+/H+ antiporter subunit G [Thermoflexales bacterium]|nr:Na+/H+ antiporter subunit G [Thermoflexales bacterium]